jgi:hypothetical protein
MRPMRPTKRNNRRGSREAECIPTKICFEAAIQSTMSSPMMAAGRSDRSQTTAQWMESRLSTVLCLSIFQPTIHSPDYPICFLWRYTPTYYLLCSTLSGDTMYNRLSALLCLSILLPTIHSALSGDILHRTILCTLLCLATLHSAICCTMPVDITTYYPFCFLWRYTPTDYLLCSTLFGDTMYNRLSALLYLAILPPTIRSNDFPLYFVGGYTTPDYPMCSTLPGDTTLDYPLYYACPLQLTVRSPDYPLCSVFAKCYNRLSAVLGYLLCSTISRDTTTEYPLCSTFRYYNRLSALLCLAILQPTIPCALLYLLILQPSIQSTDYPLLYVWRYYKRLSSCCAVLCLAIYVWRSRLKIICTSPGQIF